MAALVPAQETQAPKPKMPDAILFTPMVTLLNAVAGQLDLIIDIEAAPTKNIIADLMMEVFTNKNMTKFSQSINVGAAYNFMGTHLTGLYVGAYPGIGLGFDGSDLVFLYNLYLEAGYQYAFENKLILNGYMGYVWGNNGSFPRLGFKIGFTN